MVDPIFYVMLAPLGLAIVIASFVLARGRGSNLKRRVRLALLILGAGILIPVILFIGFTALYFAGGGH
jgi:hypothetical protein